MKAADILHFSYNNIKQNKARSFITLIAVYLLGILIMSLLCTAVSFSETSGQILKNKLKDLDFKVVYGSASASAKGFSGEDYEDLKNDLTDSREFISSVCVYFPSLIYCYDFDLLTESAVNITKGEVPSSALSGNNYIYLSEAFTDNYKIGDGYTLSYDGGEICFTVRGFYKKGGEFTCDCFADVSYMFSVVNENCDSLTVNCVKNGDTDYAKALASLKKITNAVRNNLPEGESSAYCAALEMTEEQQAESAFIIGGAITMAAVLLLLSIGSVANSMIISMDRNHRLSALMRAMGITAKDLYKIFICECTLTVIAGIILAFLTLIALYSPLKSIMYLLAKFIYGYSAAEFSAFSVYVFPAYIPAATAIFFIAFTFLFAVRVLREQTRKNPVEILGGETL